MNLTDEQRVEKIIIEQLYANTLSGIFAHLSMVFFVTILLYSEISINLLSLGILTHLLIISIRFAVFRKFLKVKDKITDFREFKTWIFRYQISMIASALAFGVLPLFIQHLSVEYHYSIFSILIAISAGAIFTIGEHFSIYLSYLLALYSITFVWMIMQNINTYNIGAIFIFIVFCFAILISYRYSKSSRKLVAERDEAQEHVLGERIAQEKVIQQKGIYEYQSKHDFLTDLPNRTLFEEMLMEGIQNAQHRHTVLALYFIDLDNFKVVNDSLGQELGDKILLEVTNRLSDVVRKKDTLARWGGDEFCIILNDVKDKAGASQLAQRILKTLGEPFIVEEQKFYITCSIGISLSPKDGVYHNDIVRFADTAMHKAKKDGKNHFQFYKDNMTKLAFERVIMSASLREAIDNEEFIVYYQPQMDAKDNTLIGMEALVRWNNPKKGLIPPIEFIALAEETGMIVEIDKQVMNIAMKQLNTWHEEGFNPGTLSLNLSIKHLEEKNYIDKLKSSMLEYSLDSTCIELELTESDIMKKPEKAIIKLTKITQLGIKIAIDDFGTGYSSLAYLQKLPISKLKIDKAFIDDISHNEDAQGIVNAVIAMAKCLKLNVIAEGVEDKQQKDFLLGSGCNIIQGYYYAKPMPADEMKEFMKVNYKEC